MVRLVGFKYCYGIFQIIPGVPERVLVPCITKIAILKSAQEPSHMSMLDLLIAVIPFSLELSHLL